MVDPPNKPTDGVYYSHLILQIVKENPTEKKNHTDYESDRQADPIEKKKPPENTTV